MDFSETTTACGDTLTHFVDVVASCSSSNAGIIITLTMAADVVSQFGINAFGILSSCDCTASNFKPMSNSGHLKDALYFSGYPLGNINI